MDIIRTKVFPGVDRKIALEVLQRDRHSGAAILIALADKRGGTISGVQRLAKTLTTTCAPTGKSISNYAAGYIPLAEADIDICVLGFGKRFPCEHAWIMSTPDGTPFLDEFGAKTPPVNQNSFLPGAAHVLSVSVFGVLALAVNVLPPDNALSVIEHDDALAPFGVKSWSYLHFRTCQPEREQIAKKKKSIARELKRHTTALERSVRSKAPKQEGRSSGTRVTLSGIAKKHYKRLGYVWNKAESQPRVTVLDKVTERGNIIRITADAGGHDELIPYVEARFLSASFISPATFVVGGTTVNSESELQSVLGRHDDDVRYYEDNIAALYDRTLGACHPTITRLLQEHSVRQMI